MHSAVLVIAHLLLTGLLCEQVLPTLRCYCSNTPQTEDPELSGVAQERMQPLTAPPDQPEG